MYAKNDIVVLYDTTSGDKNKFVLNTKIKKQKHIHMSTWAHEHIHTHTRTHDQTHTQKKTIKIIIFTTKYLNIFASENL